MGGFVYGKKGKATDNNNDGWQSRNYLITVERVCIQTAQDIQEVLKDLLGGAIKEIVEAQMSHHLGYEKSERSESDNARNGHKLKRVHFSYGNKFNMEVLQDRKSTFEPQIILKRQKDISDIDRNISSQAGGFFVIPRSATMRSFESWQMA